MKGNQFIRSVLTCFLLCSLFSCGNAQSSKATQTELNLAMGESVDVNGVSVTFTQIAEDSRCPRYTNCIWEGRAIVDLQVKGSNGAPEIHTVIIGALRSGESANKVINISEDLNIEVVDLKPYPGDEEPVDSPVLILKKKS